MPYKIRNAKGLYSTGGSTPHFTREGKTWASLGQVKQHLKQTHMSISGDWVIEEHGYIKDVCLAKQVFGEEK